MNCPREHIFGLSTFDRWLIVGILTPAVLFAIWVLASTARDTWGWPRS